MRMYAVFIDFTKAFKAVFCDGLWEVLKHGCPEKFINLVKSLHEEMQAFVVQGSNTSSEFAELNRVCTCTSTVLSSNSVGSCLPESQEDSHADAA